MSTTPSSTKPPIKLSPETVEALLALTPAQREQATRIAARLLARKAHRKLNTQNSAASADHTSA